MRKVGGERPGAVFFDMDGTLIDSEPLTDILILRLIDEQGLPHPEFPLSRFHGVVWSDIAETLVEYYPQLAGVPIAARLQHDFHRMFQSEMPAFIPGAQQAFATAAQVSPVGVVSSSQRATVEAVVEEAGLSDICRLIVGAEDVQRSKPDPECYLLAAKRLAVTPAHCLVFEDSAAGLQAARAAGMYAVGIIGNRDANVAAQLTLSADLVIRNFEELAPAFFSGFGKRQ